MKEQVSVDKEEYEMLKKVSAAWNELQNRQGKSQYFGIIKSDYERLKRLEENVKLLIEHKKSLLASARTNSPDNLIRHEELFLQIDELESLDK